MKRFVNSMIKSTTCARRVNAPATLPADSQARRMTEIANELLKHIGGGDEMDSPKGSWGLPPVTA